ncbi:MAG: hypothetical protein AB1698_22340, partial [Pseudomonadota bacterium]
VQMVAGSIKYVQAGDGYTTVSMEIRVYPAGLVPVLAAITTVAGATISGTAPAGASVEVLIGSLSLTTTAAGGLWSVAIPWQADGTYAVLARATVSGTVGPWCVPASLIMPTPRIRTLRASMFGRSGVALDFAAQDALREGASPYFGSVAGVPSLTFSRASSAYRTTSMGVMESAASGVIRFDYANGAPLGVLLEGARTNSIKNNSMQGAGAGVRPTGWVAPFTNATGITIAPVGGGVETGIDYSDWDITGTASVDGTVFLYCWGSIADIPATPGQIYSGSLFCKVASGSLAGTTWVGGTGANGLFITPYNSSAVSISGGQNTVFTPTSAPLSQCRVATENWTTPANTAYVAMYVRFQVTAGIPINLRLRIGWPQIELGPSASSPIRTINAAATRAADLLSMPSAGLVGATEGTLFIDALTAAGPIQGVNGLINLSDGTLNNRITLYLLSNANRRVAVLINSGGVSSVNASVGSAIAAGGRVKAAISWSASSAAISVNGGTPTTFTGVVVPPLNNLLIGGNGGNAGNSWGTPMARGMALTTALSISELQALTT